MNQNNAGQELSEDVEEIKAELENISEAIESNNSFWQKLRNFIFTIVALMLALGQWGDVKDVVEDIYSTVITNFTNNIEYNDLSNISVGITKNYFIEVLGEPRVIKTSAINPSLEFYYIFHDKFLLCGIFEKNRLKGYSVLALKDDFYLQIPFSNLTLQDGGLINSSDMIDGFVSDSVNIVFYLENQKMGIEGVFYNRALGAVYYSEPSKNISEQMYELEQQRMFGNDASIVEQQQKLRRYIKPNYLAISELPLDVIAESQLTKYEYNHLK